MSPFSAIAMMSRADCNEHSLLLTLELEALAEYCSEESRSKVDAFLGGFHEKVDDFYQALETSSRWVILVRAGWLLLSVSAIRFVRVVMGVETMRGATGWGQMLCFGLLATEGLVVLACLAWVRHQRLQYRRLIRALASSAGAVMVVHTFFIGSIVFQSPIVGTSEDVAPIECVFLGGAFITHLPSVLWHFGLSLLEVVGALCLMLCVVLTCPQLDLHVSVFVCALVLLHTWEGYHLQWKQRTEFLARLDSGGFSSVKEKFDPADFACDGLNGLKRKETLEQPHDLVTLAHEAADKFGTSPAESRGRVGLLLQPFDTKTEALYQETNSRFMNLVWINCAIVLASGIGMSQPGMGEETANWDHVVRFLVPGAAGLVGLACLGFMLHNQQLQSQCGIGMLASLAGMAATAFIFVISRVILDGSEQVSQYVFLISAIMFHSPRLLSDLGLPLPEAIVAILVMLLPLVACPAITLDVSSMICAIVLAHMIGGHNIQWRQRKEFLAKLESSFYGQSLFQQQESASASSCSHETGTGNGAASTACEDFRLEDAFDTGPLVVRFEDLSDTGSCVSEFEDLFNTGPFSTPDRLESMQPMKKARVETDETDLCERTTLQFHNNLHAEGHCSSTLGSTLEALHGGVALIQQDTSKIMSYNTEFLQICNAVGDGDEAKGLVQMQHMAMNLVTRLRWSQAASGSQNTCEFHGEFDESVPLACPKVNIRGSAFSNHSEVAWYISHWETTTDLHTGILEENGQTTGTTSKLKSMGESLSPNECMEYL